jgi:hypothetical protein
MSAAATAAGYLYASGRLRARTALEGERAGQAAPPAGDPSPLRPRPAPKIQYRSRRWKPQ